MDLSQYLEIFIEEAKEHLQSLNQSLLELEKNPQDTAMLNEIFRVSHTLKGMAGTMGFSKMATLTHDMEDVLHALRSHEISVDTRLIDLLFRCLDALENYVEQIISTGAEGENEYREIIQALSDVIKNKSSAGAAAVSELAKPATVVQEEVEEVTRLSIDTYEQNVINKALQSGHNAYQIHISLNQGCLLKSARAFIIFQTLEKHTDIIKSLPKVEDIEDEKFDLQFTVAVVTSQNAEFLRNELNAVSEVEKIVITPLTYQEIDEPTVETGHIQEEDSKLSVQTIIEAEKEESTAKGVQASAKPKTGKTVRVDIERLDVLMNLVSELIITKTRLEGIKSFDDLQIYNEAVEYLERVTTSLNDAVMKVRMVPVETVFNRFPRMIRDIAKELNKEIVLTMSGEETELDRTVIDEIGDPLIHMLRNSADHGIESKERRAQLGKPETGHISLRAYQAGNRVLIEVEDDGEGIHVEKVRAKAIERGLISKEIAKSLSKKDIIDFLFKPSFSTMEKVTDLSGRGVGLDVVKTKIEALGGNVEVETEYGKGTKFIIMLPLTLSIIQALLVLIGDEKYAIPLNSIKQIIKITPEEIKYVQKQEVILMRNTVVPIVRLDEVLEVNRADQAQKQLTAVIVKKGEKLSGLIVDQLIGQQEIVIKSLGKLLSGIKMIAGATILGDGNVALILDVNSLT